MRVRLYEVGARAVGVLFIDAFPAHLALTEDGRIQHEREGGGACCRLEDVGGQILLKVSADSDFIVNNAAVEECPLMPGDRLKCGGHDYLVSYESTRTSPLPPSRFRIPEKA